MLGGRRLAHSNNQQVCNPRGLNPMGLTWVLQSSPFTSDDSFLGHVKSPAGGARRDGPGSVSQSQDDYELT